MNTIQIAIIVNDNDIREQLVARLSLMDFDSFEEKDTELVAFIAEKRFDAGLLDSVLSDYNLDYSKSIIQQQNWNAIWESNFQPVIVNDFCAIRAEFHQPSVDVTHDIIITPKMSFGTGHHPTTYLMISEMSRIEFGEKQVADFGTGTGVLAILAEKLGARYVSAIDHDDWSIENSKENIEKNGCKNIKIEKANHFHANNKFDVILANINKNIIMENAENLASALNQQGKLLLSGLLKDDEKDILSSFIQKGLRDLSTTDRDNWICILLTKS